MVPAILTENILNERDKRLLERAYDNIMKNVSASTGCPWSPYRGIRPGRNEYFKGIWNWDSAFHAMCVSRWDKELAIETLRAFMQYQREDGMFADVIRDDGKVENILLTPLY